MRGLSSFFIYEQRLRGLEQERGAGLHSYRTKNGSDDSSYDLQNLLDSGPFELHFEHGIKLIINEHG